jgi:hypothetical protein
LSPSADSLPQIFRYGRILSRAAVALSFAVVFIGAVWAVVRFSIDWGEFLWTQRAFDEPFYLWRLANEGLALGNRFWGDLLGAALLRSGASFDLMAEAYAFLLPLVVFAGAWLLAGTWENHTIKRLVWALLLLMAFDLLSGSNAVVYDVRPAKVLEDMLVRPELLKQDLMIFFLFCRRPEQQSSFIILFLYLAGVFGSFLTWRRTLYWIVCAVTPLLAFVYVNVAVIAAMVFVMLSVASGVVYRRPVWVPFTLAAVATIAVAIALSLGSSAGMTVDRGVFATHLPFLRPSLAFSILGLCVLAFQVWRSAYPFKPRHWIALACLAVPLITLNQQVVTGRAILPQNWELSGNYICVVAGYAMLALGWREAISDRLRILRDGGAVVLWLALLAIMVRGQLINEAHYQPPNNQSVAYGKVYREAVTKVGSVDAVVLPHLWDESLFVTRVSAGTKVLGGYNWILDNWPPAWTAGEDFERHAVRAGRNFDAGFETLARRGVTPAQLRASMEAEIKLGSCWPTMMYFFALQDCWPTFSNYTSPTLQRLHLAVGPLVTMYEDYLKALAQAASARRKILLIVPEPLKQDDLTPFRNSLVASFQETVGGNVVRAYAYMQAAP